ncbi:flagellar export protein FliJ [Thermoproteota archaeon]
MAKPRKSRRFQYNLETVLKYRDIREKQERDKFNEALRKLEEEKRKEHEIKEYQNSKYNELTDIMSAKQKFTDIQAVMNRKVHLEVVKEQVIEQVERRKDADKKKEEQRDHLITAVKEKKVIEKNKERKRDEWRRFMNKEETKFLDDISTSSFSRQQKASGD